MSSSEAPQLLQLTAHAQDESTRIDILDGNLQIVPNSSRLGETTVQVPAGAYAVRFHIGSDYVERTAIITPQSSPVHVSLDDADAPHFATSAPVRQTRSTPESHLNPAQRISREPALDKCGGQKADGQRCRIPHERTTPPKPPHAHAMSNSLRRVMFRSSWN